VAAGLVALGGFHAAGDVERLQLFHQHVLVRDDVLNSDAVAGLFLQRGAKIVEGYPQELDEKLPAAFVWTGVYPSFEKAGFTVAARRTPKKPIMRRVVE